jgi:hypothetical protein
MVLLPTSRRVEGTHGTSGRAVGAVTPPLHLRGRQPHYRSAACTGAGKRTLNRTPPSSSRSRSAAASISVRLAGAYQSAGH